MRWLKYSALVTVVLGLVLAYVGRRRIEEALLTSDASRRTENFGEVSSVGEIPRYELVKTLADHLRLIELNPYNKEAYDGAVWCYCAIGSLNEATALRNQADKLKLDVTDMDASIASKR
jgi:hypothetical protein